MWPAPIDPKVSIAGKLAAPIFFARVDLYGVEGSILFGELTFTPDAGTTILSRTWNRKLGNLIRLPG